VVAARLPSTIPKQWYSGTGIHTRSAVVYPSTPGDFDNNGTSDIAVFRPSTGVWYVRGGSTTTWGGGADIPVAGDYDGDGKSDIAVFRPSNGEWWILMSGSNFTTFLNIPWGSSGDTPITGDFDGDRKTDIAIFRPSTGAWWILQSSNGYTGFFTYSWGVGSDTPILKRP